MLFNSYAFAVFFPTVTLLYFALAPRRRWAMLLLAGCVFYAWFIPAYLAILALLIVVDYVAGIGIEGASGSRRKWYLGLSLCANLGLLGVFKYYTLLVDTFPRLPALSLALPIGLSFHTFQAMSYTIEVYRGRVPAERHLGIYALYVLFYPQLVAGPIERPQNLLPQLRESHNFDYDRVVSGLQLMAWGLFKKIAVADRLAQIVNPVYAVPVASQGPTLALATLLFSIQIYCDFSGYSDIAIGAARVMGYDLAENFRRPYFARSLGEFWRRWHITLSSWFRDYVYIPLGGGRRQAARNVFIVFALSGLWHGAHWNFLIWGVLHAVFLLGQQACLARVPESRWKDAVGWLSTFTLVTFAWIFFRSPSWLHTKQILKGLTTGWLHGRPMLLLVPWQPVDYYCTFAALAILLAVELCHERGPLRPRILLLPAALRWTLYYGLFSSIILFSSSAAEPFLYFQF